MLFCGQVLIPVYAQSTAEVSVQEDQVNREPWDSYQKIIAFEKKHNKQQNEIHLNRKNNPSEKALIDVNIKNLSTLTDLSLDAYLQLLLRKAQSENLLYFHQDFAKTVHKAQKLINQQTPSYIASQFNVYAGIIAQREGLYAQSVKLLTKAIEQALQAERPRIYIMAKGELAYTRSLTELYETSLSEVQTAYVDAFELGDQFLVATINEVYGAVYGYLKEYAKSIEYYEKALESYGQLGYKAHVAEAIYGMASTYRYWGKYDLAITNFQLYLEKVSYTPNTDIAFFGYYGLGMSYAEKGDCQHALPIIDKAFSLNGQIDYNAELYKRKAICLIKLKQLTKAQKAINAASNIFNKLPELKGTNWQLEVEKISAMLANAQGFNKKAYALLAKYEQKHTQLQEKISSERLIKVRTALQIERRDIEMSLLQQRAKVQGLVVEKKQKEINLQRYIIVFVAFIVVCIVIFLLYRRHCKYILLKASMFDPLSGAYSRSHIFSLLEKYYDQADLKHNPLRIMLVNIDDFKSVNDKHGYVFGDEIIKQITHIFNNNLPEKGVVGRISSKVFLCVLPDCSFEESEKFAKRLSNNVADHVFLTDSGELYSVNVCFAFAQMDSSINNSHELYQQAESVLNEAKNKAD